MATVRGRGAWPPRGSLPLGWQEVLNPKLTRRGLLGGMVASPVALLSTRAFGEAKTSTWYDLNFVIAEDQSAVSVEEVEVKRTVTSETSPAGQTETGPAITETRCLVCKWSVPAAAFGEDAFFDMAQPTVLPIDHQIELERERVLHVRQVVYGLRFTREDPEGGRSVTGPDGKKRKPGFVSFRFKRPSGEGRRWTIAYETDFWLRTSGNTEAVQSSHAVEFATFLGQTVKQTEDLTDKAKPQPERPSEIIAATRVGGTLGLTFGSLVGAGPKNSAFNVSLDRHLVWHVEAIAAAALFAHDGRVQATKIDLAWRRLKDVSEPRTRRTNSALSDRRRPTAYFSGECDGRVLSLTGVDGVYRFGATDGHNIEVKPKIGAGISLNIVVGRAPFLPREQQAICALRIGAAALSIRKGQTIIADGIGAGALTVTQTVTPRARAIDPVARGVIWGEALGAAAPFALQQSPDQPKSGSGSGDEAAKPMPSEPRDELDNGLGRITTPIGPLVVAKPIRRLDVPPEPAVTGPATSAATESAGTETTAKDACKPQDFVEATVNEERDEDALVRFFHIANGDRAGAPEASVYALADRAGAMDTPVNAPAEGAAKASSAVIRRAHIDLTLRGAATALPDTSFSELAFQRTELRLAYEDGAPIDQLPGGEYPLSLASSYVWIGPNEPALLPLAVLDLSRAVLTCARDYDLMKLRLRFHNFVLHYGPEPTVRPAREEARLRVREDGELQDGRPLIVAEFDPQHVMEEAIFLPETPALPDVELEPLPENAPPTIEADAARTREAILQHLSKLKTTSERIAFRKKIKDAKIARERQLSPGQKGPFETVAEAFSAKFASQPISLVGPPAEQQVYIGPFALDADSMGVARQVLADMGDAAVAKNLVDTLTRGEKLAAADSPLRGKQLEELPDAKIPPLAPPPDPDAVYATALRNEAVLESLEPFYGVFRSFWRNEFANPGANVAKAKIEPNTKQVEQRDEYLNKNNRPKDYPPQDDDALYTAMVGAFVEWALGRRPPEGLMGARLSGPSRLAFRVNAETPVGVDAREAGALPTNGDGLFSSGAGNTRFRPIRFTFEGLTEWSRFEPAVTKRAQKLFQTLPSGVLPRPGNRPVNPSDQAMMRFQGFTEGAVTGEARMAEVRASLKSERIANLETGDNKPWPGEPLDFETAIELPSRLILSTAQDAYWRTNRRIPKELFLTIEGKACPVLASDDSVPELENGKEPAGQTVVNEAPYDLWSVRLETRGENPGIRAVASPDLRPSALVARRKGRGQLSAARLPGEGPPPRGPYAPWFIGLDQLENETLDSELSNGGLATRLTKWLRARTKFRKELPSKDYTFFRTSLDAFDRHQLVLLSSTYGLPVIGKRLPGATENAPPGGLISDSGQIEPGERFALLDARDDQALHRPVPFKVKAMSLTALGGSLLHETAFKPSAGADDVFGNKIFEGFSIDTLQQDIVLGRDIRTEVVYKGYLLPLGHQASFVKLTERIFLHVKGDKDHGVKAILRQRMFLRMADPEKLYGAMGQGHAGRQWCAKKVRLTTDKTPDILDPTFPLDGELSAAHPFSLNGRIWLGNGGGLAFWPRTDVTDQGVFRFPVTIDGAPTEMPMIFIDNIAATSSESVKAACDHYNALPVEDAQLPPTARSRTLRLAGRKIDYAPNSQAGEGQFETERIVVRAQGRLMAVDPAKWVGELEAQDNFFTTGVLEGANQPPFYPTMEFATIRLGRVERMSGGRQAPIDVQYDGHYVRYGFPNEEPPRGLPPPKGKDANPQEVFLVLRKLDKLDMGDSGDRSGGIARPNSNIVAISRSKGPMGGDEGTWWSAGPGAQTPGDPLPYNGGKPDDEKLNQALQLGGLVSLAPYFNDLVERPTPAPIPDKPELADEQDPYVAVVEEDDTTAAAIAQVKSFFSMDAKLLGTVRLKHIMKLLGLSLDSIPVLKEVQEFGTAASDELDQLSNDVRSRVLAPLRDIVARLRREWRLFDAKVAAESAALQQGLDGLLPVSPLSLAKVYPEVESGLKSVETALDEALATEDAAGLVVKLAAVHAAARQLLRGLAIIAANPVERLDDAITGNLKEKIEALTEVVENLGKFAEGFRQFFENMLDPGNAADFVVDRIFEWFGASATPAAPAPPSLADLMPLASLPPALPALARTLIIDVDAETKAFLEKVDLLTGQLSTKIAQTSQAALKETLKAAFTALFSGTDPGASIKAGVERYRDTIEDGVDMAIGEADTALTNAANGANSAVATAASALRDALKNYRDQLEADLWNAALDIADKYPDELQAIINVLATADTAIRSGKTLATALKDGNPTKILKESSGFARDVLGLNVGTITKQLEDLEQTLVAGFISRIKNVLRGEALKPIAVDTDVPILALEMAALRLLPNRPADKPWPLPIIGDPPNVVASNALLLAVGKTLFQLIAAVDNANRPVAIDNAFMPPDMDLETFRKQLVEMAVAHPQVIEKAAEAAGTPELGATRLIEFIKALKTLIEGKSGDPGDGLIAAFEGLYGDLVNFVAATRGIDALLDNPPVKGRALETALGDILRRQRQLGKTMASRLETIVARLTDFANEHKNILAAGALIGGAATVLDGYLKSGALDEINQIFKGAIAAAKAAFDKVDKEIVTQLTVIANFALSLIGDTAAGGEDALELLASVIHSLSKAAGGFGFDLNTAKLSKTIDDLKTHLKSYKDLAVPAKTTLRDFLNADLGGQKTPRTLFATAPTAQRYQAVESALRDLEADVLREWRKLRDRLAGAPEMIRQRAEQALIGTGVFGLLQTAYVEIVTQRDALLAQIGDLMILGDLASKVLTVPLDPALDKSETEPTVPPKDRLDQEAAVAADLAAIETSGALDDSQRRRLVALLRGWSDNKAAPLAIKDRAEDLVKDIMRGDVLAAIDFGGFRDQIEDAIAGLIPTKVHLSYDFGSVVTKDAGRQAIFRPLLGSDFGIALRATIDLLNRSSEFGATASIGPFEIFLIGGIVDALRLKFGGAAFTVATNTSPRFDVLYEDFVIGKDLEFAQELQSFLSPKGGGAFIQPMTRGAGIEVGYGLDLGTIGVGATSFFNVSLNVSAELPFGDQESLFKVSLGRRLSPFTMGVFPFVGSGYFAIYAAANGIRGFEASFEYGGGAAIGYGPFQASVRIQAGVFVRIIRDDKGKKTTEIYGTFFAGGSASIWIFHFATSIYVRLGTAEGGAMYGEAIYSFSFSLGIADYDYSITAYKKEKALGNQPTAASLDHGGSTRFAALPPGVDPMTTGSHGKPGHIVVNAADQADGWQTYATYFDNDLTAEFL